MGAGGGRGALFFDRGGAKRSLDDCWLDSGEQGGDGWFFLVGSVDELLVALAA